MNTGQALQETSIVALQLELRSILTPSLCEGTSIESNWMAIAHAMSAKFKRFSFPFN